MIDLKKRYIILLIILITIILTLLFLPKEKNNTEIQILDNNDDEISLLNNYNKTNSENINNINPKFIEMLLCIEDKDFYKHHGFSIKRIAGATINNLFSTTTQGASTITQQYIKTTYLNNSKNILRKIKEIILSIKLEYKINKDVILEKYLSSLYFGNNIYGLTNACKYYYNSNINELSASQMISLISLINAPSKYSNNLNKWHNKNCSIAKTLLENNIISKIEYNKVLTGINLNVNNEFINSNRQYFIDLIINEFKELKLKANFNQTIIIKTKYNKNTEQISSNLDTSHSIISLTKEGYISSIIGDKNYYQSTYNIAINGKRDIGSTIKPLLYYEAIKCGQDKKIFTSNKYSFKYNNEIVTITNSSNIYYNKINLYNALAVSDNIYAIKMHMHLGMNTLVNHLKKYNISAKPLPSLALGSVGMDLKKLASIYFQFFNNGKYIKPRAIEFVIIDNINYHFKIKYTIVNNITICNKIKELLYAPFDLSIITSTCNSITNKLNTKCYGKSGLTDYDSYMVGFNEDNLVAVWSGDINNRKLINPQTKKLPKELFYKMINAL